MHVDLDTNKSFCAQVKCDGRPNGCRNCERLQLECVADDGSTASGKRTAVSPVALRKIRTYRSCQSCRLSKTKCNGDRPKCSRCAAKLISCMYDGGATPRWTRNLDKSQATSVDEDDDNSPSDRSGSIALTAACIEQDEDPSFRLPGNMNSSDDVNDKSSVLSEAATSSATGATSQSGPKDQVVSHPLSW